jgi:hypothetical protein
MDCANFLIFSIERYGSVGIGNVFLLVQHLGLPGRIG